MKIEIWSDYVCPFCYIGKKSFEEALSAFPHKDKLDIEFKSFQLDPNTPPYTGEDYYESVGEKFGGAQKAKEMMAGITEKAKESGLDFHFDTMKNTNTFDAHRLMKFARTYNKDFALSDSLFYANFTKSEDIGDTKTLADLAHDVGLDRDKAFDVLEDKDAFASEVRKDIEEARQFQISGVPAFVFNRKYLVSGAQPVDAFTQALNKLIEEA